MKYYTYSILVDSVVRYVGKGCHMRAWSHVLAAKRINRRGPLAKEAKFHIKLAKAINDGSVVDVRLLKCGCTSHEALRFESDAWNSFPKTQLWGARPCGGGGSEKSRQTQLRRWARSGEREKQGERARARLRVLWANPEYRKKEATRLRAMNAKQGSRPEFMRNIATLPRKITFDFSQMNRERWADQDYKKRVRQSLSVAQTKRWARQKLEQNK